MKKKNKPGQGRKSEGRVRGHLYMRPEAWAAIAAEVRGKGDTLGKAVERKYGVPDHQNNPPVRREACGPGEG